MLGFYTEGTESTETTKPERRTLRLLQREVARNKEFRFHGYMKITFSLPEDLVKRVRKIAVGRGSTLTGLVRRYLSGLARQEAMTSRKRREREALERGFEHFQFRVGNKTWKREDLHKRA
jgi:hypothetical protein